MLFPYMLTPRVAKYDVIIVDIVMCIAENKLKADLSHSLFRSTTASTHALVSLRAINVLPT